ncbi:MAG: hypothetical protein IPH78_09045 [Bacteroidetes bacterium]|nr:hypothetical protein [Bacteroidota bacterium]
MFADEERLRDKVSDIYWGVNFYEGEPTTSQVNGLNNLQREVNANRSKVEERKKTYRPKVSEALKKKGKKEPY